VDNKQKIKVIEEEIRELRKKIGEKNNEILLLKIEDEENKTGFKTGDLIEVNGVKGILRSYGGYWWKWSKLKKDGTPSMQEITLYSISGCKKIVD
jgi:hypothetical protein